MTVYEIADLRATLGARLLGVISFWASMTLAVFVAAQALGSHLDLFTAVALIGFYLVISFSMACNWP